MKCSTEVGLQFSSPSHSRLYSDPPEIRSWTAVEFTFTFWTAVWPPPPPESEVGTTVELTFTFWTAVQPPLESEVGLQSQHLTCDSRGWGSDCSQEPEAQLQSPHPQESEVKLQYHEISVPPSRIEVGLQRQMIWCKSAVPWVLCATAKFPCVTWFGP